ncbi:MAG: hypothetical protein LBC84_00780 [Prevotellaceae bacterium]|jgi:hypothetical protein|nr:hypothetical protein [Prevotellaceae bacterium]
MTSKIEHSIANMQQHPQYCTTCVHYSAYTSAEENEAKMKMSLYACALRKIFWWVKPYQFIICQMYEDRRRIKQKRISDTAEKV